MNMYAVHGNVPDCSPGATIRVQVYHIIKLSHFHKESGDTGDFDYNKKTRRTTFYHMELGNNTIQV